MGDLWIVLHNGQVAALRWAITWWIDHVWVQHWLRSMMFVLIMLLSGICLVYTCQRLWQVMYLRTQMLGVAVSWWDERRRTREAWIWNWALAMIVVVLWIVSEVAQMYWGGAGSAVQMAVERLG